MKRITAICLLIAFFCLPAYADELKLPLKKTWWTYYPGLEFPGAVGSLKWTQKSLRLDGNFRKGGDYVMAFLSGRLALPPVESLTVELRTDADAATFRIMDGAGKMHQYQIPVKKSKKWQTIKVPMVFSACSWGGPDNKSFTQGISYIACLVRKATSGSKKRSFLEVRHIGFNVKESSDNKKQTHALPPVLNPDSLLIKPGGTLTLLLIGPDTDVAYSLVDYGGKTVDKGSLKCKNSQVKLKVPETEGYFDLHIAGDVISFLTFKPRTTPADPYWGIDESFSWWGAGGDFRRDYMRFLVRSGITWGRDRIRWSDLHPERNRIDLKGADYERILGWSKKEGLHVLNVFHDSPSWNKRLLSEEDDFMVGATSKKGYTYGSNVYPRNYVATSESWEKICRRFSAIEAMEVWNEPDIGFSNDFPAEFFIALTKNFSTTFRLAGLKTKVIGGVLAIPQETTPYYHNLIVGGLLDDCDAFSFHTYRSPLDLEEQIYLLREQEKDAGRIPGFPFWITESGRPWPSGPARPDLPQDRFSAQEIVGKAIEARALGLEKHFPFFTIWHIETIFNFSMFDKRHAPMRSIGAYVAAVRLFSNKEYIGDLKLPGTDLCRVFSDGKTAVAWVYKSFARKIAGDWGSLDHKAHKRVHVKLPEGLKVDKILGADGRALEVKNGELPMGDGLCYLVLKAEDVKTFLDPNTRAMTLYQMAKQYQPKKRKAKNVIIQPDYDPSKHKYNRDGVFLKNDEVLDLKVIFNNLSNKPVTVQPALKDVSEGLIPDKTKMPAAKLGPRSIKEFTFKVKGTSKLPLRQVVPLTVADLYGNATPMLVYIGGSKEAPPLEVEPLARKDKAPFTRLEGKEAWNSFSGQWTGQVEPDISADFRFTYDKNNLYLEVKIRDEEQSCIFPPMMAWLGDSVQVALASDSRQIELCASNGLMGQKVYRHVGSPTGLADKVGFKWKRSKSEEITYYNLTIPASELELKEFKSGMKLRCSLLLNSGGPDGRHGFLIWGEGIRGSKKVSEFNRLILK